MRIISATLRRSFLLGFPAAFAAALAFSGADAGNLASPQIPSPPAGSAAIWYLGHCGYAVRTPNYLLIFDYQEKSDGRARKQRPEKPSLDLGWIDPAEIKNLKVRVFVSHSHEDHFDPVSEHAYLKTKTDRIDLAFVFPVIEEGAKYTIQERDLFSRFKIGAAFPMHATAGDVMYQSFHKDMQARFPGLVIHVPMKMGQKFAYSRSRP